MTYRAKTCTFCRRRRVDPFDHDETLVVAGVSFVATVRAARCAACGETVVSGGAMERLEQAAAAALVARGHRIGAVLRFARKTLGLTAKDLSAVLDVAPETISRWETGEREIDTNVLALVAALLRDRLGGRDDTAAVLRALHAEAPKPGREPIRLELR